VGDHLPVALYLVSSVAIAILLALVVYRYVERPMTLLLQHRFAERTVPTRADVPAAAV
jgi:peptidoglycan/LPS O-acetylase OafA/YrhL